MRCSIYFFRRNLFYADWAHRVEVVSDESVSVNTWTGRWSAPVPGFVSAEKGRVRVAMVDCIIVHIIFWVLVSPSHFFSPF